MIHHITISNVKCEGCVNTIKAEIGKLQGANSLSFNNALQTLNVARNIDRATLINTLEKLGYPEAK